MTRLTKQKKQTGGSAHWNQSLNAKSRAERNLQDSGYLYSQRGEDGHNCCGNMVWLLRKQHPKNKKLKTKNAELEESLASAQKVSALKQIEDFKLRCDYDSAVAILEQIPPEVLELIKHPA